MGFSNIGDPAAALAAPTAEQFESADKVDLFRSAWTRTRWTNHKLRYSLEFRGGFAHTPVLVHDDNGPRRVQMRGMVKSHFDEAIGAETAAGMSLEVTPIVPPKPTIDRRGWTRNELRDEAKERGLKVSGTKDQLVARLKASD